MHLTREDGNMKNEKITIQRSKTPLSQWLEGERKLPLEAASWFYITVTGVGGLNTNKKI